MHPRPSPRRPWLRRVDAFTSRNIPKASRPDVERQTCPSLASFLVVDKTFSLHSVSSPVFA